MKSLKLAAVLAVAAVLAACSQKAETTAKAGNVDGERIAAAAGNGEWLSYGRTYDEQRHSPLDKINASNVGQLGLAWMYEFDTDRGQRHHRGGGHRQRYHQLYADQDGARESGL